MTIALLNHTDGRITNHYLNRWFRTLLRTDLKYALSFLKGYQQEVKEGWILERMLLDVAEVFSETGEYDGYVIKLLESLPNNVSNELLQISVNILNRLMITDRVRAEKFYINILSRFHFAENPHSFYEKNLNQECVGRLMEIGDDLGLPITHYKKYFADIKQEENSFPGTYDDREAFMCESVSEAKDWFGKHFLRKDIYEDVTAFLLKIPVQSDEMAEIFRIMIEKDKYGENEQDQITHVQYLLEHIPMDKCNKSHIYCMIFCHSKSWNHGLVDAEMFLKAYQYDPDATVDVLCRELPPMIYKRGLTFSYGLINALSVIGGWEGTICEIWKNTYSVIRLRFPHLEIIDEFVDENDKIEDSLIGIIMGRMMNGEKERMQAGYSFLMDCLYQGKENAIVVALLYFLENFGSYNYLTQSAVLEFISKNALDFSAESFIKVMEAVSVIFPTKDCLLDRMILESGFLVYAGEKDGELQFPEIELKEYLHPHYLQELGDKKIEEEVKVNLFATDKHLRLMYQLNLEGETVYKKVRGSKIVQHLMAEFSCPNHRLTADNTVLKSYIMQYSLLEILKFCIEEDALCILDDILSKAAVDFQELDFYRRSRCLAPENNLYGEQEKDIEEAFACLEEEGFQRIACIESVIDSKGHKSVSVLEKRQGICLKGCDIPLKQEAMERFEGSEGYVIIDDPFALCFVGSKFDINFEGEQFLWVINGIVKDFHLVFAYDAELSEHVGIDWRTGDIVLRLRNWRCNYIGDSEYSGYEIPLYKGVELLMKVKYIRELIKEYGDLYMRTIVKKVVNIEG